MNDEVTGDVTIEQVRALLGEQHPDLADLPIERAANGWDNTTFRLGVDLTVRVPRRTAGALLIEHERAWLPTMLEGVPDFDAGGLDASAHVRDGHPGVGYPWGWAVGRWQVGEPAAQSPLDDPRDAAERLGRFLAALHRPAPAEAPENAWRGGPLSGRSALLVEHLDRAEALGRSLGPGVTADRVRERWAQLLEGREATGPPTWIHGDLHLANLLVDRGRLRAVIDFGDLTAGDRATDLAVAWPLLADDDTRARLRSVAGAVDEIDDDTWRRAQGWALALGVAYLQGEHTTDAMEAVARRQIAAVLAGDGGGRSSISRN